jgi:hypothetical protein
MRSQTFVQILIFAGALVFHNAAYAAPKILGIENSLQLLGRPLKSAQLDDTRARGEIVISTASNGSVSGNQVSANSVTGTISDTHSITNNSGVTTVMQNTGNNALLQSSTSIYVSVK